MDGANGDIASDTKARGSELPAPPLRDAVVFLIGAAVVSQALPRLLLVAQPPIAVGIALIFVWLGVWAAWLIGFPMWVARRRGLALRGGTGDRTSRWVNMLIGIGVAFAVLMLNTVLAVVFESELSTTPSSFDHEVSSGQITFVLILFAICATTFGPFAEELSFRWLVYGALRARVGVPIALLLQAIAFTAIHSYDLLHLTFVFIGGVALGCVYEWRRSLTAIVTLHIVHNAIIFLLIFVFILITQAELRNTPMLGVGMEQAENGVRVAYVVPASPAEIAGIREGDVINGVGDYGVQKVEHLGWAVLAYEVGDTVTVYFLRDGEQMTTVAMLKGKR